MRVALTKEHMKIKTSFKEIGQDEPVFIIAEAGVNHNGDIDLAHKLIDAAADVAVDAVKFQTFLVDELVSREAPLASHHISNIKEEISHYDLLKKIELPLGVFEELKKHCEERGVVFISTPYDIPSAKHLIDIKTELIKIASSEMLNYPLLHVCGDASTPIVLSTGMSDWQEIEESVAFLSTYEPELCILKCTSNYPADFDSINLRGITRIHESFENCLVGFSDHTVGNEVSIASLGIGVSVIEKHFTLDRSLWGPDHCASMIPSEFDYFVKSIRAVEKSMGKKHWQMHDKEKVQRKTMQKGVYARSTIKKGETLNVEKVKFLRPKGAISPKEFWLHFQGKKAKMDIEKGDIIRYDLFGM
jgi:N,N'-diacetyllegionaminate synthase